MVPEIWNTTDIFFLSSWAIFCHFTPLTAWKMKILKMKTKPGDIIILNKGTKNSDHRLYCSWDMASDGCNCYFHFGLYFSFLLSNPLSPAPPPPTYQKIKISKQLKKCLEISSIYTIVSKITNICYNVPEIWCVLDVIVIFHFGHFFALFTSLATQKIMIICCTVSEIRCVTDISIIFHFGPFFDLLLP